MEWLAIIFFTLFTVAVLIAVIVRTVRARKRLHAHINELHCIEHNHCGKHEAHV